MTFRCLPKGLQQDSSSRAASDCRAGIPSCPGAGRLHWILSSDRGVSTGSASHPPSSAFWLAHHFPNASLTSQCQIRPLLSASASSLHSTLSAPKFASHATSTILLQASCSPHSWSGWLRSPTSLGQEPFTT